MSNSVVRVKGLGKRYQIGMRETHNNLRETLANHLAAPMRFFRSRRNDQVPLETTSNAIWALRDVSFEVKQGEVIGVIGRNGAGKSTLLKILTRITEPTEGFAEITGRVGSLLEVGTGFHPELSGRENIFLNGAIMGMARAEIQNKFDEIVDFSGVEKFLDTPVKRYSSGMRVRLAFSVAAHLDPEILLVDEVLAVGDAEFQKKCLGKMGEVASGGRTVVLVSHQMNAIRTLCTKCILLAGGRLSHFGPPEGVVAQYLESDRSSIEWTSSRAGSGLDNPYFYPQRLVVVDRNLNPVSGKIRADEQFGVLIEGTTTQTSSALTVGFAVRSVGGELLFWALHTDNGPGLSPTIRKGHTRLIGWVPKHLLNEGAYLIELMVSLHYISWISQPGVNAPSVRLEVSGGLSESPYWIMARPGLIAPIIPFDLAGD